MVTPEYFIGIDVSKLTLDIAVIHDGMVVEQQKIENSVKAVKKILVDLKKKYNCTPLNSFLCAEQMGPYNNFLTAALVQKKYTICMDSPLRIKRSLGIQRGKTDAIDAVRIARYASWHYERLEIWQPPREIIQELKLLSSLRKRLIKARTMITTSRHLEIHFMEKKKQAILAGLYRGTLESLRSDIKNVERKISGLIHGDERLSHLNKLVTSVPSIGEVIATELLIVTNEFKNFSSARKFATYCGVAPFECSSGTSVRGKARVSKAANKEIKSILYMAVVSGLRQKSAAPYIYYQRKKAEGKNKMSVMNALRNKLVHYIFACVKNDRPFSQNPPGRQ